MTKKLQESGLAVYWGFHGMNDGGRNQQTSSSISSNSSSLKFMWALWVLVVLAFSLRSFWLISKDSRILSCWERCLRFTEASKGWKKQDVTIMKQDVSRSNGVSSRSTSSIFFSEFLLAVSALVVLAYSLSFYCFIFLFW